MKNISDAKNHVILTFIFHRFVNFISLFEMSPVQLSSVINSYLFDKIRCFSSSFPVTLPFLYLWPYFRHFYSLRFKTFRRFFAMIKKKTENEYKDGAKTQDGRFSTLSSGFHPGEDEEMTRLKYERITLELFIWMFPCSGHTEGCRCFSCEVCFQCVWSLVERKEHELYQ